MTDDDAPGGSPACFLDEVDAAYAGYLTEAELGSFLAVVRARAQAALAMARAAHAPSVDALAALVGLVEGELTRRKIAHHDNVAPRFAPLSDSTSAQPGLAALEAELVAMIETALPRIADDTLHAALNRALDTYRGGQAAPPAR